MFKLILLMAVFILAASAVPVPVPPLIAPPLVYSHPYVKVLPLHTATLPLSYAHSYKWYHPGSVYVY
ncbi:hypothetical protein ANTQUA_LOCUS5671 [Anthophora quadrimaculata]